MLKLGVVITAQFYTLTVTTYVLRILKSIGSMKFLFDEVIHRQFLFISKSEFLMAAVFNRTFICDSVFIGPLCHLLRPANSTLGFVVKPDDS